MEPSSEIHDDEEAFAVLKQVRVISVAFERDDQNHEQYSCEQIREALDKAVMVMVYFTDKLEPVSHSPSFEEYSALGDAAKAVRTLDYVFTHHHDYDQGHTATLKLYRTARLGALTTFQGIEVGYTMPTDPETGDQPLVTVSTRRSSTPSV